MSGFGWKQLKSYGPFQAKRTAEVTEKIMPIKFKEIHVIHESYLARMAYSLMKNFLSEEFGQKIHFHGSDLTKLHQVVSPEILPPELGGLLPQAFDTKQWFKHLLACDSKLIKYWKQLGV
jgi:retinaldehyde-binding protein 1